MKLTIAAYRDLNSLRGIGTGNVSNKKGSLGKMDIFAKVILPKKDIGRVCHLKRSFFNFPKQQRIVCLVQRAI